MNDAINVNRSGNIVKGPNNFEMTIYPTRGNTINDVVTLRMTQVTVDTKSVEFALVPQVEYINGDMRFYLGIDVGEIDGWNTSIDTKTFPDGYYTIIAVSRSLPEARGPGGSARIELKIENQ